MQHHRTHSAILRFRLRNLLVAELRSDEQEPCAKNTHCRCYRYSVEVFHLDLSYHVFVGLECDLENVSLLRLNKEEEHGLGLVGGGADEDHAAVGIVKVVLHNATWWIFIRRRAGNLETNYFVVGVIPDGTGTEIIRSTNDARTHISFALDLRTTE